MSKVRVLVLVMSLVLLAGPAVAKKGKGGSGVTVMGTIYAMTKPQGMVPSRQAGVPKAVVALQPQSSDGKSFSMTTNAMGNFEFDNVPNGTYTLAAVRPGVGQCSAAVTVDGKLSVVNETLNLSTGQANAPFVMPTPTGQLQTTLQGPSGAIGKVYIACAQQGLNGGASVNQTASSAPGGGYANNNSFGGRQIPGPPAFSMGYAAELMYNGGDPWLLATGHKRPNPYAVFGEGHIEIPATTLPHSIMRLDAGMPQGVQYAASQSNPYWLALDANGTELFAATDQQTIEVYDTSNAAFLGSIQAGGTVTDVELSPDGNWIFAADSAGRPGVIVIDPHTRQPVRFIPTPRLSSGDGGPAAVAVSPDSRIVYVSISSAKAGEVVAIDTMSKTVVGKCPVGRQPIGLALTPDGRLLFCANNGEATCSVIDVSRMVELQRIHVGIAPTRVAVTPDGTKAYITCRGSNSVSVVTGTSSVAGSIPVGQGPTGLAITPDGRKVIVANTMDATISIIDTARDVVEHETSQQLTCRPFGVVIGR